MRTAADTGKLSRFTSICSHSLLFLFFKKTSVCVCMMHTHVCNCVVYMTTEVGIGHPPPSPSTPFFETGFLTDPRAHQLSYSR